MRVAWRQLPIFVVVNNNALPNARVKKKKKTNLLSAEPSLPFVHTRTMTASALYVFQYAVGRFEKTLTRTYVQ